MDHIGMDVHKKHTVFCVVDDTGGVIARGKVESTEAGWRSVLGAKPASELRLALETGTMAWWLVAVARDVGIEPVVVDARQFKLVGMSKRKSDRRDAFVLAEALRTGLAQRCAVVVPSERARRGRSLLQARMTVKKQCTIARNATLGLLRSVGECSLSARRWASDERWEHAISSSKVPDWMRDLLRAHRRTWASANEVCVELDRLIYLELALWPEAPRLRAIPAYGPMVTLAVLCAIDDPTRFRRSKQVGGYAGLAPTVRSSGETCRVGSITRQGSSVLRHCLIQGAHSALRSRSLTPALRRWVHRLQLQRGRNVAVTALARRLLVLGHRLLRTGEQYDPTFGSESTPAAA